MKLGVHLNFSGNAGEAFAFYEQVFGKEDPGKDDVCGRAGRVADSR